MVTLLDRAKYRGDQNPDVSAWRAIADKRGDEITIAEIVRARLAIEDPLGDVHPGYFKREGRKYVHDLVQTAISPTYGLIFNLYDTHPAIGSRLLRELGAEPSKIFIQY